MARKSKGRQKVEMVKMPKESNLQVTFSKRRSGLFKKASELCTLCGVDVAVIVFSPGKKVFSFGHPSVESMINRFITRNPPETSGTMQLIEAHRNASVCEFNMQLTLVLNQLEAEKRRGEELSQVRNVTQSQCWWAAPIDELSSPQLDQLKFALKELKNSVTMQAEKVLAESSAHLQYFAGSSSARAIVPFDVKNVVGFNHNMQMMPPPHQPNPISSPRHPHSLDHGFNPEFGRGFY